MLTVLTKLTIPVTKRPADVSRGVSGVSGAGLILERVRTPMALQPQRMCASVSVVSNRYTPVPSDARKTPHRPPALTFGRLTTASLMATAPSPMG